MAKQKEDLRVVRTRKLLYQTIFSLLETCSIEKLSVVDICENAMVHRTTFYAYFENKYHLLSCAIEELKNDIFKDVNINSSTTIKDMCRQIALAVFEFVDEHNDRISRVLNNNRNEKVVSIFRYAIEQNINQLLLLYKNNVKYKLPLPIISNFFTGGFANLAAWWIDNRDDNITREDWIGYMDIILDENIYIQK